MVEISTLEQFISFKCPNMIHNRFDLVSDSYEIFYLVENGEKYVVEVEYRDNTAYLGLWLNYVSSNALNELCETIFKKQKEISQIKYEYSLVPLGYCKQKNHYRIILPNSEEELHNRLSKKGRYNINREKRVAEECFGSLSIVEYTSDNVPDSVMIKYFELKKGTHGVDYKMTPLQYLKSYYVTHIYVLYFGDDIAAIVLSCEQCPIVYIENITYDKEYAKYSAGQILYDLYLSKLTEKAVKEIYLAGGNLDYKKRYGSIEDKSYVGTVYKHKFDEIVRRIKDKIKLLLEKKKL